MSTSLILLLGKLILAQAAEGQVIDQEALRFEEAWFDAVPPGPAEKWRLPFQVKDRTSMRSVMVVSSFGQPRQSYLKGHIHTGVDLDTRPRHLAPLKVLAMARGAVCSIHLGEPHTTVVVRHLLPDGSELFTSYKHLAEVYVRNGQEVDTDTELGRLFTPRESARFGGDYHHLHLEVRRLFDDRGVASWLTMNREDLERRFLDPLPFLRKMLVVPAGLSPRRAEKLLAAARKLLGLESRPEEPSGELKPIDYLKLLFYAAEGLSPCSWRSYSVLPTQLVKNRELGVPVPGMDPLATRFIDLGRLKAGDIVLMLSDRISDAEPPLAVIDRKKVWVWHGGIFSGDGKWIHADFSSGKVVEEDLVDFINEHAYPGIFVLRMSSGPAPSKCLTGQRLRRKN